MGLMYTKYPHPEPIEQAVKPIMSRQLRVSSLQPSILCSGAHTHIFVLVTGQFVGTRSDRGDVQLDGCGLISKLQVLVHNLDVRQG